MSGQKHLSKLANVLVANSVGLAMWLLFSRGYLGLSESCWAPQLLQEGLSVLYKTPYGSEHKQGAGSHHDVYQWPLSSLLKQSPLSIQEANLISPAHPSQVLDGRGLAILHRTIKAFLWILRRCSPRMSPCSDNSFKLYIQRATYGKIREQCTWILLISVCCPIHRAWSGSRKGLKISHVVSIFWAHHYNLASLIQHQLLPPFHFGPGQTHVEEWIHRHGAGHIQHTHKYTIHTANQ